MIFNLHMLNCSAPEGPRNFESNANILKLIVKYCIAAKQHQTDSRVPKFMFHLTRGFFISNIGFRTKDKAHSRQPATN